jgi:hypothetical protein
VFDCFFSIKQAANISNKTIRSTLFGEKEIFSKISSFYVGDFIILHANPKKSNQ